MDPSPYGSEAPKDYVTKRFKLLWRILLISNLGLGAYMFAKARKKDMVAVEHKGVKSSTINGEGAKSSEVEDAGSAKTSKAEDVQSVRISKIEGTESVETGKEETKVVPEFSALDADTDAAEESGFGNLATEPLKVARKPIPEDEQRELFNWILEEKRKIKPKCWEEKKRIDEEKAILKQFIRAEKIPKFIPDDCFDSSLRDWDKFFSQ